MARTFYPASDVIEVVANPAQSAGRGFWGDFERHRLNAIKGHLSRKRRLQGTARNPGAIAELANPEDYAVLDNVWWGNPRRKYRRHNPPVGSFFSMNNLIMLVELLVGVAVAQGFSSAALAGQTNPSPWADPFLRFLAMGILGFFSNASSPELQDHLTAVANGAGVAAVASVFRQFGWIGTNFPGLTTAVGGGTHRIGPAPTLPAYAGGYGPVHTPTPSERKPVDLPVL